MEFSVELPEEIEKIFRYVLAKHVVIDSPKSAADRTATVPSNFFVGGARA
jgi:hypothetical protein